MTERSVLSDAELDEFIGGYERVGMSRLLEVRVARELQQARAALKAMLLGPIPARWAKQKARACLPVEEP